MSHPRYVLVKISHEEFESITTKDEDWECVAENHHGSAHWNISTGEFAWSSDVEVQLSRLNTNKKIPS